MLNLIFNFRTRAIVNYMLALFLLTSALYDFLSDVMIQFNLFLGTLLIVLTNITDFKYSLFKRITIRTYGRIELSFAISLIVLPAFFFSYLEIFDIAFCISLGAILILLNIITDKTKEYDYSLT
ncbi:hypothetical protein [Spongiimicrobium salis]|uniref:hypothetical protein n=1 Tax=Spongiimicrobium salis TaxID=1667022 RepID=UPI00374CB0F4